MIPEFLRTSGEKVIAATKTLGSGKRILMTTRILTKRTFSTLGIRDGVMPAGTTKDYMQVWVLLNSDGTLVGLYHKKKDAIAARKTDRAYLIDMGQSSNPNYRIEKWSVA